MHTCCSIKAVCKFFQKLLHSVDIFLYMQSIFLQVEYVLGRSTSITFQTPDGGVLCGDLLYSGHTCQITTAMFTIWRYSPKSLFVSWFTTVLQM